MLRVLVRVLVLFLALFWNEAILTSQPSRSVLRESVASSLRTTTDETTAVEPLSMDPPMVLAEPLEVFEAKKKGRSDYALNVGKCIDTLKYDLPLLFDSELDESVYAQNVELRDPSGVQLQGKTAYRQVFSMIRLFKRIMVSEAAVNLRLHYDEPRQTVTVRWNSKLTLMASQVHLYVDCVSHYSFNDKGFINRHQIERVDVNSRPLSPPYGNSWLSLRAHLLAGLDLRAPIPAGAFFQPLLKTKDQEQINIRLEESSSAKEEAKPQKKEKTTRFNILPDSCENIWDCDSPLNCCDYGLFKVCCNSGAPAFRPIPIPVPIEPQQSPWDRTRDY